MNLEPESLRELGIKDSTRRLYDTALPIEFGPGKVVKGVTNIDLNSDGIKLQERFLYRDVKHSSKSGLFKLQIPERV